LPVSGTLQIHSWTILGWIPCCQLQAHPPALEELKHSGVSDTDYCVTVSKIKALSPVCSFWLVQHVRLHSEHPI
jgi:hypothetical protein